MLTPSVLIRFSSNLQRMRTDTKSRTSSNFGQVGPLPSELGALECLKLSHRLIIGKCCLQASTFIFDWLFIKRADNLDRNLGRVRIPAGSDQTLELHAHWSYMPLSTKIIPYFTFSNMNISKTSPGHSWSNFMCSINGVGERLHKGLGQIGSKLWLSCQPKAPIDL